jgi:outer membrane protein TolC
VGCRSSEPAPSRASLADWVSEREQATANETPLPAGEQGEQAESLPLLLEPPPGDGRAIGLQEVLTLVETQGLDILLARERLVEVRAEESIAEAAWWPSLSLGTTLYRNEGRVQNAVGFLFDADKQNAWAGGGVRLDLDLGEAIYGTRAARYRTAASSSTMLAETQNASTLAALAYFTSANHSWSSLNR